TAPGQAQAIAEQAAAAGAERVLTVETDAASTQLNVPTADALAAAAAAVAPDAVLISNSMEGRDVAGRFAARTSAALAIDAVGLPRDGEGGAAHHSVYGGAYNVDSAATFGPLVVTVREGAVETRAEAKPVALEALDPTPSGRAAATIDSFEAVTAT